VREINKFSQFFFVTNRNYFFHFGVRGLIGIKKVILVVLPG